MNAEDKERSVRISGGTFFLCLWLVYIAVELWGIKQALFSIAEKLK